MIEMKPCVRFPLAVALVMSGISASFAQEKDAEPALLSRRAVEIIAADDELTRALKERYNAAIRELASTHQLYMQGKATLDIVYAAGERVLKAGMELFLKPEERIELLEQWAALSELVKRIVQAKYEAGVETIAALEQAKYFAADARVQLLRAKKPSPEYPRGIRLPADNRLDKRK